VILKIFLVSIKGLFCFVNVLSIYIFCITKECRIKDKKTHGKMKTGGMKPNLEGNLGY